MVFGIPEEAILLASATLFGAMVGAVVPSHLQKRRQRKTLRLSLQSEIENIDVHQWNTEYLENYLLNNEHPIASTTVFENNAGQIGLLTNEEINAVVTVYSRVENMRGQIRGLHAEYSDHDWTDRVDESQREVMSSRREALIAINERL